MDEPQPNATPDAGAVTAQPAEVTPAPAATPQEPQATPSQPAQVDETTAWFQSKGVDPSDPAALQKVAEMARNAERMMTKATQEASELKKSLTQPPAAESQPGVDPVMGEFIQDYRRDKLINGFKESHPDWHQHEATMASILQQPVNTAYGQFTRSQLVNSGILSLDDVYAMAKAAAPVNTEQIQTQAKQEVLQTLANTQRAGGGSAHASQSNPQAPAADPVLDAIRKSRG